MNPLQPMNGPNTTPAPGPQPGQPAMDVDPKDVDTFHGHANTFFQTLQGLAAKPPGQLNKEDVFKAVASLMGKGLFADPKSQQALIMQLTQMPDDEATIRQMIGQEMLQTAHVQNEMRQRFPSQEPPNA